MNCTDAAEYISALCDGETIPNDAAQHISSCAVCTQARNEYVALGMALWQAAAIELAEEPLPALLPKHENRIALWWRKGWEQMRIPRVAFAMLVLCLVLVGTRLAMVEVGAQATGTATKITVDLGAGMKSSPCYLQGGEGSHATVCGFVGKRASDQKTIGYEIKLNGFDGKRFRLAIRAEVIPPADLAKSLNETLKPLPMQDVWFVPGKKANLQFADGLALTLQGEWAEHVPPYMVGMGNPRLDPNADELRISSPLLLRDKAEVGDLEGAGTNSLGTNTRIVLYYPKAGLLMLSLGEFPGAVKATVRDNRVSFTVDGHEYTLINAAPVTRAEHIWVARKQDYKPSEQLKSGFLANPYEKDMGRFLNP
jgi:hypothetical protein